MKLRRETIANVMTPRGLNLNVAPEQAVELFAACFKDPVSSRNRNLNSGLFKARFPC